MGLIKDYGLESETIRLYSEYGDVKKVADKLCEMGYDNIFGSHVDTFIKDIQKKTESPALFLVEQDAKLVKKNMQYRLNLQKKTIDSLQESEDHVSEIESHFKKSKKKIKVKCECGRTIEVDVPVMNEVQYHKAKDSAIRTKNDLIKHLRATQIKFIELAKNQILRESMMSVIRDVDPDVANKIFEKIEQKQKELGII